ncbi:demethylmenaquinone methyltransferase-like [Anneissia japonica]|uniref:demethylmenaquinone methyltransferase-like n=1 Tax=Anneissia japonica TaxID=1529436 RepID=UPI0014258A86|nr:demethylmenaquinone methyltransferase-like [Anneissia japonica]
MLTREPEEIADAAKLKPRYVKELLGALSVSGIVEIDPTNEKYFLPHHRRDFLNTKNFKSVCVQSMQLVPKLCLIRKEVKECFKLDGPQGIPQSVFLDFAKQKSEINAMKFNHKLVTFIERVDGLVELLENGAKVIDLACGAGDSTLLMAHRFPKSNFLGVDFVSEQLETGRQRAKERNLGNVDFEVQNIEQLPKEWNEKFDFIFCHNVVHDLAHPSRGLEEFHRVLKASGIGLIIDLNLHTKQSENVKTNYAVQKYIFSMLYCVPGSLYFDGGEGLGAAWGVEKAVELIERVGFNVTTQKDGDKVSYICKKEV